MLIIDSSNEKIWCPDHDVIIKGEIFSRGLELPEKKERCSVPYSGKIYSREEIIERIKERDKTGVKVSDIIRKKGIPTSNQNGTNFCWTYGVVSAIVAQRAYRNLPYIEYSRESVAAPIKGYKNNGGWGEEALKYIIEKGIMPQELWPKHYYSSDRYNTEDNREVGRLHVVTEFQFLPDRNFLAEMSALIDGYQVAVGFNKWRHEVCSVDAVLVGSKGLGRIIWNSWGPGYGEGGFAILSEEYGPADDAVVPIVQALV